MTEPIHQASRATEGRRGVPNSPNFHPEYLTQSRADSALWIPWTRGPRPLRHRHPLSCARQLGQRDRRPSQSDRKRDCADVGWTAWGRIAKRSQCAPSNWLGFVIRLKLSRRAPPPLAAHVPHRLRFQTKPIKPICTCGYGIDQFYRLTGLSRKGLLLMHRKVIC
jgi:hypothetical protein